MLKRTFTGLLGLALLVTLVSIVGPFRLVAIGASPLPSGCYTDSSGLAVCGPNYVGPGGTPGPGVALVAGTCIQVTPTASPPSGQIISVNGSGCTPPPFPLSVALGGSGTAAPAPTSSNGCTITGTWPSQTFGCPTPGPATSPQVTPPITQTAGVIGLAIGSCFSIIAGVLQINTTNATCSTQGGASAYQAAVLALGANHLYTLTTTSAATACPSTFPDLATSSPVPLPTSSSFASTSSACGSTPIIHDGTYPLELSNTSVTGQAGASFLYVPASVTAAFCPAGGSGCTNSLTVGCTVVSSALSEFEITAAAENFFNIDSDGGHLVIALFANASGGQQLTTLGFAVADQATGETSAVAANGVPYQIVLTFDGTTTRFYVNGIFVGQNAAKPSQNGSVGAFGAFESGLQAMSGRIEDCYMFNTVALTAAQIQALYLASGLP